MYTCAYTYPMTSLHPSIYPSIHLSKHPFIHVSIHAYMHRLTPSLYYFTNQTEQPRGLNKLYAEKRRAWVATERRKQAQTQTQTTTTTTTTGVQASAHVKEASIARERDGGRDGGCHGTPAAPAAAAAAVEEEEDGRSADRVPRRKAERGAAGSRDTVLASGDGFLSPPDYAGMNAYTLEALNLRNTHRMLRASRGGHKQAGRHGGMSERKALVAHAPKLAHTHVSPPHAHVPARPGQPSQIVSSSVLSPRQLRLTSPPKSLRYTHREARRDETRRVCMNR
jgi:hypothetical protein